MKLSYIISIIIGGAFFSILYILLDFGFLLSLVIAVIAYFSSTMLFKEKSSLDEIIINEDMLYSKKLVLEATDNINKIEAIISKMENSEVSANVTDICDTSRKIISALKDNSKKSHQVRKFVDYYLPFTFNILTQYDTVENQRLTSLESINFMKKVESMILRVKEACYTQLNNMYETDIVNTSADIKVFETMLKSDGLVDDNMNIKVEREEV